VITILSRGVGFAVNRSLINFADGHLSKKHIDKALVKMVTKDFQPLSIVEDEGFRCFV
jgi:hypothetical protein